MYGMEQQGGSLACNNLWCVVIVVKEFSILKKKIR